MKKIFFIIYFNSLCNHKERSSLTQLNDDCNYQTQLLMQIMFEQRKSSNVESDSEWVWVTDKKNFIS